MLSQLYIRNIAVIKEATIDLKEGFNVFTGETGAGKSMLIGALSAVLGERTSKDLIRTGEKSAQVSALFHNITPVATQLLEEMGYGLEEGEELLLTREIGQDGKTSCRINGRPATVAMLKALSGELINIHGQHDNQQLITPDKHLKFVDDFGDLGPQVAAYQQLYHQMTDLEQEIKELSLDELEKARKLDLLQYQIEEITAADLQLGEEEILLTQRKKFRNRERVVEALSGAKLTIDGEDELTGLGELLDSLIAQVSAGAQYIEELGEMATHLEEMSYEIQEYHSTLADLLEDMEYDADLINEVEERLDLIYRLKKKYGTDIEDILNFLATAGEELDRIQFSQERVATLQGEWENLHKQAYEAAKALSEERKAAADDFAGRVSKELAFLDMPSVKLLFRFREHGLTLSGVDDGEMLISTNPGEPPKPLVKIASGGELSRIMLSIKNAMADKDQVDTLIFDEIDAGVSGRAAQKIGQKLGEVSKNRQVICVTHLAQVAAYGDYHLLITKTVQNNRTFTQVVPLSEEERVYELARITSGDNISEITLQNAKEMLLLSKKRG